VLIIITGCKRIAVVQEAVDSELQPLLGGLEGRQLMEIPSWTF